MEITVIHGPGESYDLAVVMRIRDEQGSWISTEIRSLTAQRKDTTLRVGLSRVLESAEFWRVITPVKAEGEVGTGDELGTNLEARNLLECGYVASICNGSWSESDTGVELSQKGVPPSLPFCKNLVVLAASMIILWILATYSASAALTLLTCTGRF